MKCPVCGKPDTKVIDSRPVDDSSKIRRRRECEACQFRFTTFEHIERSPVWVIKKDGSREEFDRNKVLNSMLRACRKHSISVEVLEKVVDEIESRLLGSQEREISSIEIGEIVLSRLRELDEVAYIRFASVYRDFSDVNTFFKEIKKIVEERD